MGCINERADMVPNNIATILLILFIGALFPALASADDSAEDPKAPEQQEKSSSESEPPRVSTWDDNLVFTSEDERFSMMIRGRIQPRYELATEGARNEHSSIYLRRVRLEFRGHAHTEDLTYRIMPELNRTATLRDAWLNHRFSDAFALRAGQYHVPFAWERDSSSNFHQFVERSTANNQFQPPTGRDIGVMAHGTLFEDLRYLVGAFNGQGLNEKLSDTLGHLLSGRLTYTLLGEHSRIEALVEPADELNFTVGTGAYYAFDNTVQHWNGEWIDVDIERADVFAATGDMQLQIARLSAIASGFFWDVRPSTADGEADTDGYQGWGATGQVGVLAVPERLFSALRFSHAEPNLDVDIGRQRELMAGVHLYMYGNAAKLQLEAGGVERHDGDQWRDSLLVQAQYQLLF